MSFCASGQTFCYFLEPMLQITYKAACMKMTKPKVVSEPTTSDSPTVQTCRIGSGATKTVAPAIGARQWLTPIQSRGCAVVKVRVRSSGFRVRSLEVEISAQGSVQAGEFGHLPFMALLGLFFGGWLEFHARFTNLRALLF